jgi:signal transduction histidine kinase
MENPDASLISKLNEAKSNAEDANKTKTDFLSSMSHEIRTPLNAIVGFGQALAKEDISGTAKDEVKDILMASNTLLDIVNGILDISKIESNKIEIINGEYILKN